MGTRTRIDLMEQPRIENLNTRLLVGKNLTTNMLNNRTFELWSSFMPNKKQIANTIGSDLYSIQCYNQAINYQEYNHAEDYTLWAAIEVSSYGTLPKHYSKFTLDGGLYAVFIHRGLAANFKKTMNAIFEDWLPTSNYKIDHRPHFEILGDKYKNNHPSSEEEVWIPIKPK